MMRGAQLGGRTGLILLLALLAPSHETAARPRHCHGCRGFPIEVDPFGVVIPREPFLQEPPSGLSPDYGPEYEPPLVPEPSPSPGPAPFPQGFSLDVPVKPSATDLAKPQQLNRYRQVADAIAQCWNPPARFADQPWRQITLRVSFKRDGTVNGMPRIPYVDEGLTGTARSDLTQSLLGALRRCTPLPFSPGLGGAIAGQVFALRFIEQDQTP